jgi:hypothetical protein
MALVENHHISRIFCHTDQGKMVANKHLFDFLEETASQGRVEVLLVEQLKHYSNSQSFEKEEKIILKNVKHLYNF